MLVFKEDGTYSRLMSKEEKNQFIKEKSGFNSGFRIGYSKGLEDGRIEVAQNMLANGINEKDVSKISKLPLSYIRAMM